METPDDEDGFGDKVTVAECDTEPVLALERDGEAVCDGDADTVPLLRGDALPVSLHVARAVAVDVKEVVGCVEGEREPRAEPVRDDTPLAVDVAVADAVELKNADTLPVIEEVVEADAEKDSQKNEPLQMPLSQSAFTAHVSCMERCARNAPSAKLRRKSKLDDDEIVIHGERKEERREGGAFPRETRRSP